MVKFRERQLSLIHILQGFDPLRFLKRNASGGIELEPRYQRLWFRLACPDGKMLLNRLRITDQIAVYEAQVFLSREDNQPIANFTAAVEKAQAPAGRYVQACLLYTSRCV